MSKVRCEWCLGNDLSVKYHDEVWGVPVHNDRLLFEFLVLDGAQAGLSWLTILKKRENYFRAFDGFDVRKVAGYGDRKIEELMADKGIVRNRLKIKSAIQNARVFLDIQQEFGSFDKYLWGFVGGETIVNRFASWKDVPATSDVSDKISKDLKKRRMSFVGSTIIYAYMQGVGLVNDHIFECFRYNDLSRKSYK